MGWYRGDCHVHSLCSNGGELTVPQLAEAALAAGLDFVATTEHNTAQAHRSWAEHARDGLLVILGQEVTTSTGHWLALGLDPGQVVDWRYGVDDNVIGGHLDAVQRAGGLSVAAHPFAPYPTGRFAYPYEGFDVVEVWNGLWVSDLPWNADNEAALAQWSLNLATHLHNGRWRPAMGNSDTHLEGQIAVPHTVVRADELSVRAVLAGIKAGRSWIAGSTAIDLTLQVTAGERRAGIGESLPTGGRQAEVSVIVRGVPDATVSIHTERGRVHSESLPPNGSGAVSWRTGARRPAFVRVEVRHPGGHMAALTNPVILI